MNITSTEISSSKNDSSIGGKNALVVVDINIVFL